MARPMDIPVLRADRSGADWRRHGIDALILAIAIDLAYRNLGPEGEDAARMARDAAFGPADSFVFLPPVETDDAADIDDIVLDLAEARTGAAEPIDLPPIPDLGMDMAVFDDAPTASADLDFV